MGRSMFRILVTLLLISVIGLTVCQESDDSDIATSEAQGTSIGESSADEDSTVPSQDPRPSESADDITSPSQNPTESQGTEDEETTQPISGSEEESATVTSAPQTTESDSANVPATSPAPDPTTTAAAIVLVTDVTTPTPAYSEAAATEPTNDVMEITTAANLVTEASTVAEIVTAASTPVTVTETATEEVVSATTDSGSDVETTTGAITTVAGSDDTTGATTASATTIPPVATTGADSTESSTAEDSSSDDSSSDDSSDEDNNVCGTPTNNFPDNSACNPKNHRVIERKTGTACDKDLHLHEWLRFVDAKENCLKIPMFGNEDYCYKPGACGSEFPYYLSGQLLPGVDGEKSMDICASESATKGYGYCCKEKLSISLKNCGGHFMIYKFNQQMKHTACGRICATATGEYSSIFETIRNEDKLPVKFDSLKSEEKDNLVAVLIGIDDQDAFKSSYLSGELLQKFKYQLSDALESTVRSRRDTGTTDQYEIDIIEGTPRYTNSNEDEVLIVFLVKDANSGQVVSKKDITLALTKIEHRDTTGLHGASGSKIQSITDVPAEYQRDTDKLVISPPKSDPLWIAIIIIIGITACITAVCLIATLCYRLSIRRRSGTAKISQKALIEREDNSPSHFTSINGHDNLALVSDDADSNQNSKRAAETDHILTDPTTAENAV